MRRRVTATYLREHPRVSIAVGLAIGVAIVALDVSRLYSVRMNWQTGELVGTIVIAAALGIVVLPSIVLVLRPSLTRQNVMQGSLETLSVVLLVTWVLPFVISHNRFGDDHLGSLFAVGLMIYSDFHSMVNALALHWLLRWPGPTKIN